MAAKNFDKIVVIDVESTCWEENQQPRGVPSEIIEIGACLLDLRTFERGAPVSIVVRPGLSAVSPFCTKLTGLTQEKVTGPGALTLEQACDKLVKEFRTKERAWASFGDYDRDQFDRCCKLVGVDYPFGRTHQNIKALLSLVLHRGDVLPLDEAVKKLGLRFDGRHHSGSDDAKNAAGVLAEILRKARGGLTPP